MMVSKMGLRSSSLDAADNDNVGNSMRRREKRKRMDDTKPSKKIKSKPNKKKPDKPTTDDVAAMNEIGVATLSAGNAIVAKESFLEALARCEAEDLSPPASKQQRRLARPSRTRTTLLPNAQAPSTNHSSTTTTPEEAGGSECPCDHIVASAAPEGTVESNNKNVPATAATADAKKPTSFYIYQREEYDEGMNVYKEALYLDEASSKDKHFRDATLMYNIGQTHLRTRQHQDAKRWFQKALAMITTRKKQGAMTNKNANGGSKSSCCKSSVLLNQVMIYHNIAFCCYCLGENDDAMSHHQEALRLVGKLGLSNVDLAASCNCVGILYLYQGTPAGTEKAMEFLQLSLKIYKQMLGPTAVEVATCLSNIGRVFFSKFEYESALGLFQEALNIRQTRHAGHATHKTPSPADGNQDAEAKQDQNVAASSSCDCSLLDIAAAMYNIGQTDQKLGKLDEAMEQFKAFRKLAEPLLGPNHRDVVAVLKAMACIHHEQGRHVMACDMLEEAVKCYRASTQEYPLELALMLRDMGSLYTVTDDLQRALKCHMESLQIQQKALGDPVHQSIMISLLHIAQTYKKMGCFRSALNHYRQLYNIQLDVFGPASLEVAATLCSLGLMKYLRHDYQSSLNFYQEALRVRQGFFGGAINNYDIAATLNSIGLISFKMKLYETAKKSFIACIRIRQQLDGTVYNADIVTLYSNLATVYLASGEDKESVKLYQESIRLERKTLGEHHLGVAVSMQHLAQLHQDRGELELAYDYFKEALEITKGAKEGILVNKQRTVCTLLNLLGNIHLMRAEVPDMMDCFIEACRTSENDYQSLVIAGYTFYGISKKHPPGAAMA